MLLPLSPSKAINVPYKPNQGLCIALGSLHLRWFHMSSQPAAATITRPGLSARRWTTQHTNGTAISVSLPREAIITWQQPTSVMLTSGFGTYEERRREADFDLHEERGGRSGSQVTLPSAGFAFGSDQKKTAHFVKGGERTCVLWWPFLRSWLTCVVSLQKTSTRTLVFVGQSGRPAAILRFVLRTPADLGMLQCSIVPKFASLSMWYFSMLPTLQHVRCAPFPKFEELRARDRCDNLSIAP